LDYDSFLEFVVLSALHIDYSLIKNHASVSYASVLDGDTHSRQMIEQVLVFIEKISQSQGVRKAKREAEDKIKSKKTDKIDFMGPLRKKYPWFFKG
jgi:hypothetical protein